MALSVILGGARQVLEKGGYYKKLGVPFAHTGNDMTEKEMDVLNSLIDLRELKRYRIAVGRASCAAFKRFEPDDMNQKVSAELLRLLLENGDIQPASRWLADFWGRKTVLGMIKMPLTRHIMVHINKARRQMDVVRLTPAGQQQ